MRRQSNNAILPRGTELFHGSIENVRNGLRAGGDRLLWFADDPKIAQLYIPRAGGSIMTEPSRLRLPVQSRSIQTIQHMLGIDYDLSRVEWMHDGRARRFYDPIGWDHVPSEKEVEELIREQGYEPKKGYGSSYRFYFDNEGHVLPPGGFVEGKLFVMTPKRDLRIADVTDLGGDLMNPAHLWLSLFRKLDELGYDGVVINDYAQSEDWGNFGHRSLGVFPRAIPDLKMKASVPATYEEFAFEGTGTKAWPQADTTDFGALPPDPTDQVDWALLERLTEF